MYLSELKHADIELLILLTQRFGLLIRESGEAMPFALHSVLPVFGEHIGNVLLLGSSEKMGRIAASSIVAVMADEQIVGNRTVGEQVGIPMRQDGLASLPELTVTITQYCACPKPAFIKSGDANLAPESFFYRAATTVHAVLVRMNKEQGLTLHDTALAIADFSQRCFLAAATMTVTVRNFRGGIGRGMITHVISSFQLLTMPRDARNVAAALLLACAPVSIPQIA